MKCHFFIRTSILTQINLTNLYSRSLGTLRAAGQIKSIISENSSGLDGTIVVVRSFQESVFRKLSLCWPTQSSSKPPASGNLLHSKLGGHSKPNFSIRVSHCLADLHRDLQGGSALSRMVQTGAYIEHKNSCISAEQLTFIRGKYWYISLLASSWLE